LTQSNTHCPSWIWQWQREDVKTVPQKRLKWQETDPQKIHVYMYLFPSSQLYLESFLYGNTFENDWMMHALAFTIWKLHRQLYVHLPPPLCHIEFYNLWWKKFQHPNQSKGPYISVDTYNRNCQPFNLYTNKHRRKATTKTKKNPV